MDRREATGLLSIEDGSLDEVALKAAFRKAVKAIHNDDASLAKVIEANEFLENLLESQNLPATIQERNLAILSMKANRDVAVRKEAEASLRSGLATTFSPLLRRIKRKRNAAIVAGGLSAGSIFLFSNFDAQILEGLNNLYPGVTAFVQGGLFLGAAAFGATAWIQNSQLDEEKDREEEVIKQLSRVTVRARFLNQIFEDRTQIDEDDFEYHVGLRISDQLDHAWRSRRPIFYPFRLWPTFAQNGRRDERIISQLAEQYVDYLFQSEIVRIETVAGMRVVVRVPEVLEAGTLKK